MDRPLPSRLLLLLLAVLLQVAVLPARGRVACIVRSGSLTGCCCVAARPVADLTPGCCERARRGADELPHLAGRCTCRDGGGEPLAAHEQHSPGSAIEKKIEKKIGADEPAFGRPLPWITAPRRLAAIARTGRAVAPRTGAGPPLHVLLQVFLI